MKTVKELLEAGLGNFRRLMILFGFEMILSAALISLGIGFVATTQGAGPEQYLSGHEFTYIKLVLTVGFMMASARLFAEKFWSEDEPPEKTPEPDGTGLPMDVNVEITSKKQNA